MQNQNQLNLPNNQGLLDLDYNKLFEVLRKNYRLHLEIIKKSFKALNSIKEISIKNIILNNILALARNLGFPFIILLNDVKFEEDMIYLSTDGFNDIIIELLEISLFFFSFERFHSIPILVDLATSLSIEKSKIEPREPNFVEQIYINISNLIEKSIILKTSLDKNSGRKENISKNEIIKTRELLENIESILNDCNNTELELHDYMYEFFQEKLEILDYHQNYFRSITTKFNETIKFQPDVKQLNEIKNIEQTENKIQFIPQIQKNYEYKNENKSQIFNEKKLLYDEQEKLDFKLNNENFESLNQISTPKQNLIQTTQENNSDINYVSEHDNEFNKKFDDPNEIIKHKDSKMNPRFRKFFIQNETIQYDEDHNIEYKMYTWPFYEYNENNLKKAICAFLNSKGGRLYIGITDNRVVKGIKVSPKERDNVKILIQSQYLATFYPDCRHLVQIQFVPVKDSHQTQYIKSLFIVKIIVEQGNPDRLYSCDKFCFKAFLRLDAMCLNLESSRIEEEIIKRKTDPKSKIDASEFNDPAPDKPIENQEDINFKKNLNKGNYRTFY